MLPKILNMIVLALLPLSWVAPLASGKIAWIFTTSPITIWSGVQDLYQTDLFLCAVVFLFAMAAPMIKTAMLLAVQFSENVDLSRWLPVIEVMGKLSMADVFLLAMYIAGYRGIAEIEVGYGTYLFTGVVATSILATYLTKKDIERRAGLRAPKTPRRKRPLRTPPTLPIAKRS